MAVTDKQVSALRAHLAGDFEEYHRISERLDETDGWEGYTALITGGFFEAVNRRFVTDGVPADKAEVIGFVSHVRARYDNVADKIDPQTAERLILAAYTDATIDDLAPETKVSGQVFMLTFLILDQQLDEAGLDQFLATARKLGDRLMN